MDAAQDHPREARPMHTPLPQTCPLQVTFLTMSDFEQYCTHRILPRDGAFIKDMVLPNNESQDGLVVILQKELESLESYRAKYRHVLPRAGRVTLLLAEWHDNTIAQLWVGRRDSVSIGSELRLCPTEEAWLPRQLETGVLASLLVEAIAASSPSAKDAASLKAASRVAAQLHVCRRPKRVFAVVDGW